MGYIYSIGIYNQAGSFIDVVSSSTGLRIMEEAYVPEQDSWGKI